MSRREKIAWVLVFSVAPGIGITGLASVALNKGALSPWSIAAGLLAALTLGGSVGAALYFDQGENPEGGSPDAKR